MNEEKEGAQEERRGIVLYYFTSFIETPSLLPCASVSTCKLLPPPLPLQAVDTHVYDELEGASIQTAWRPGVGVDARAPCAYGRR